MSAMASAESRRCAAVRRCETSIWEHGIGPASGSGKQNAWGTGRSGGAAAGRRTGRVAPATDWRPGALAPRCVAAHRVGWGAAGLSARPLERSAAASERRARPRGVMQRAVAARESGASGVGASRVVAGRRAGAWDWVGDWEEGKEDKLGLRGYICVILGLRIMGCLG